MSKEKYATAVVDKETMEAQKNSTDSFLRHIPKYGPNKPIEKPLTEQEEIALRCDICGYYVAGAFIGPTRHGHGKNNPYSKLMKRCEKLLALLDKEREAK